MQLLLRTRRAQPPSPALETVRKEATALQEGSTLVQKLALKRREHAKALVSRTNGTRHAALAEATLKLKLAKKDIEARLKSIAKAERAIDEAQALLNNCYKEIEQIMKDSGITEHSNGLHLAAIVERWTNQGTVIDPQKFRAKVTNEVFWKSITVGVGKAKEFMAEKEILAIADITPSKFVGRELKIKRLDVKLRTK